MGPTPRSASPTKRRKDGLRTGGAITRVRTSPCTTTVGSAPTPACAANGLSAVFQLEHEPWIDPDAAPAEEIIAIVKSCPSGALSYSVDGKEQRDQAREPAVKVSKNGPYLVTGGPDLVDVGRVEGASTEHFTLCRCGASKNKPFCDGSHWSIRFEDEKN